MTTLDADSDGLDMILALGERIHELTEARDAATSQLAIMTADRDSWELRARRDVKLKMARMAKFALMPGLDEGLR